MCPIHPVIFRQKGKQRSGKGFSREELRLAGLTAWTAQRIGLPIDLRRSSTYQENVDTLKEFLKEAQTELLETLQASRAKKEAQAEAKLERERERALRPAKKTPVKIEEELPLEPVDVEEEIAPVDEIHTPLSDLEGILSNDIEALNAQEIEYVEDLLGLSAEDMDDIARTSGIERERIEAFVVQAINKLEQQVSLDEVSGIGKKTAELLEEAGIHSANQLARWDPKKEIEGISPTRLKTFIEKAWDQILNT